LRLILLDGIGGARVDTGSSERQILEAIEGCQA
jgi:hypothetical protein